MADVFRPHEECKKPRVVLVEGNPGMGKTTLCQKLAYDWSVGDIPHDASFPKVEILLLLKCRDINVKMTNIEEVIADQLLPQDADQKDKVNFFEFIRANQPRILLVLDGLDELHQDLFQSVLPLIKGKVVSNTYVMLTARHEAGMEVRRYCDTLLEIIGYTTGDAENYIQRYFRNHDDPSLADRLIKRLQNDEQLRESTANPLNTSLLCLVCEETGGVFPSKKTKLYDALVECALRRYFAKRDVSLDGGHPVEICTEQLKQLGKMAFEALLKGQMYFSENEMKCSSSDFLQLCFLSREPSASKIKPSPCYAFTHKTFQEYFAAFYLAHLVLNDDKGTNVLLAQLSPVDDWQVWEFLFTMVVNKNTEKAVFVLSRLCAFFFGNRYKTAVDGNADANIDEDTFEERTDEWVEPRKRISKDQEILSSVVAKTLHLIAECEDEATELVDYQKTMVHVLAHCFPLRELQLSPSSRYCPVYSEFLKVNCTISNLNLERSDLNNILLATVQGGFHFKSKLAHFSLRNEIWDRFLGILLPKDKHLSAFCDLYLRMSWIQSYGVKALLSILQSCRFLTHLHFSDVWLSNGGAAAIAEHLLANRVLTHLSLHYAMIFDEGALRLAVAIQTNCTLTHLSFQENWISGIGARGLAQSLQSNRALEYLNLSQNLGGDSVAVALARSLESNCGMKYLDLSQFYDATEKSVPFPESDNVHVELIGASGGTALGRALRVNCTLKFLNLNNNCISNEGAAAIGEALKHNCTLTHLNLGGNEVGVSGAEALGIALQTNRSLKYLDLDFNSIGDLGAAALAEALNSSCTGLSRLNVGFNKISSSGATAISEALRCNCSLTHLALRLNKIVSTGAAAFAKALQSNHALIHLNLESNDIDDSGATELAQALLYHNNTLRYLSLRNNPIGSVGNANLKQVDQANCNVCF